MPAAKAVAVTVVPDTPSSRGIRNFTSIPEPIQAVQFEDWNSALDIFDFSEGFIYVPRGFAHQLRNEYEYDRNTKEPLTNAPEFLIFKTDRGHYRIDLGWWVFKRQDGGTAALANDQFLSQYQENQF